jgi:hypothetical protein
MSKDKVSDWSATPSSNTDIGGISIVGTAFASNFDNALREQMSQWAQVFDGTDALPDTLTIGDPADLTKRFRIDVGAVTTGTTRVMTLPDQNVTITAAGAALLDDADAAAQRTTLELGDAATGTIGVDVQAYDAETLKADTADVLTAGFGTTAYDAGTQSSGTYTPDEANGNIQYAVNGGAHTLAPMTNNGTVIIHYTNNGSAGAITVSGFTLVEGDGFTTTDTDEFLCYLTKANDVSHLVVKAL